MTKAGFFIVTLVLLQACAPNSPITVLPPTQTKDSRAEMLRDIKTGKVSLDCDVLCSAPWHLGGRRQANTLYVDRDYEGLALHIARIGYPSDLSYFYLGRAAEELGAQSAALKYYGIASAIASGTGKENGYRCSDTDACNGLSFPKDINARLHVLSPKGATKATHAKPTANAVHKPDSKSDAKQESKPEPSPTPAATASPRKEWVLPPPVAK